MSTHSINMAGRKAIASELLYETIIIVIVGAVAMYLAFKMMNGGG